MTSVTEKHLLIATHFLVHISYVQVVLPGFRAYVCVRFQVGATDMDTGRSDWRYLRGIVHDGDVRSRFCAHRVSTLVARYFRPLYESAR